MIRTRVARSTILTLAAAASLAGAAVASPAGASPGTSVTSGDPFASCTPNTDDFGGVAYRSSEPEVWLTNNPANPSNLIGSIQQDRWSDGAAKGLVAPISDDGGATWTEVPLPFSVCAAPYYNGNVLVDPYGGANGIPNNYDRASDPWVSVGPDGTAYAVSLSIDVNDSGNAIGAATSTDGGHTWHNVQAVIAENPALPTFPFNDKESVTADPAIAGSAYAVWDRTKAIACPAGVSPAGEDSPKNDDRVLRAAPAASLDCYVGPTFFSRTTDGGLTWSTPKQIVHTPANEQTIANQIVVAPDGTLYDFYCYVDANNALTVEDIASHDHGLTWTGRQRISDAQPVSAHDPVSGAPLRTGDVIPEPAVDPHTGALYMVWQDSRANSVDPTQDGLFISRSTTGGRTGSWSTPSPVNTPTSPAAFTPAVKVLGNGSVIVQYYTFAAQQGGPGVLSTSPVYRVTHGPGTTFTGGEHRLGPAFNMLAAPFAFGYFTGDYEGLAVDVAHPNTVHTFYTATTCNTTRCAAVSGFDVDGNPIASAARNSTDVHSQTVVIARP